MNITINFDMDGTIADLYGVDNWLEMLIAEETTPYAEAEPLLRLCSLARVLNRLQRNGYELAIISWLSKSGSEAYNEAVTAVKMAWLAKHLPSVNWNRITIVPYGTPKQISAEVLLIFCSTMKQETVTTGRALLTMYRTSWKFSKIFENFQKRY